jgi:DNA-binding FadR family transcriptional regulator
MDHLRNIYAEHSEIYAAITAGDPGKAKKAMETHLARARRRYHLTTR